MCEARTSLHLPCLHRASTSAVFFGTPRSSTDYGPAPAGKGGREMSAPVIVSRHFSLRRAQDVANTYNLAHVRSGKREVQYSVRQAPGGLHRWHVVREPV